LNIGDNLISEGYAALSGGNYEIAFSLANECRTAVAPIPGDASNLQASAERARSDWMFSTVLGSTVGLIILLVFAFLGWNVLKRSYSKRVLNLKPVVEA
jgi:hypothetical protein